MSVSGSLKESKSFLFSNPSTLIPLASALCPSFGSAFRFRCWRRVPVDYFQFFFLAFRFSMVEKPGGSTGLSTLPRTFVFLRFRIYTSTPTHNYDYTFTTYLSFMNHISRLWLLLCSDRNSPLIRNECGKRVLALSKLVHDLY